MNYELLKNSVSLIDDQLSKCERPALACSFGKDSMVMLYLVRQFRPDIPVLYFKGLPHPTKHLFAARISRELALDIRLPEPKYKDLIAKDGKVELIEVYEVAPGRLVYFPIEPEPDYVPGPGYACAVDKFMTATIPAPMSFDALFVGHRGDDIDPTFGKVPLVSSVFEAEGFRTIYPIKDWTEADIWEFSREVGIPQNEARYAGDMRANNDYHEMCVNCLKKTGADAYCPKAGRRIPQTGAQLGLEERREYFRNALVNIDRRRGA